VKTLRPSGVRTIFFPISTRVDITVYQHGKCFIFVKSCLVIILVIAGGGGGTVLVRTNHFDGMGTIEASGGDGATRTVSGTQGGGGGGGRIAVYHSGINTFIGSLQTYGGESLAERGGNLNSLCFL
jgi:hypothetical protein